MKENTLYLLLLILSSAAWARPLYRRQVPVDPSYGQILSSVNKQLKVSNPDGIRDAMFGLLVRNQASVGQGSVMDTSKFKSRPQSTKVADSKRLLATNNSRSSLYECQGCRRCKWHD